MADGRVTIDVDVNGQKLKGINGDLDQLSGKSRKASFSIKDMAVSMGLVQLASKAINAVKNSLDGAISRFDILDKYPRVMESIGYSAEESKNSINKLSKGIEGLPTTLQDVVSTTQSLTAIMGDLDMATDITLALNNAFLASGASVEDATRGMQQYTQMLSVGKADGEAWNTLMETMPGSLKEVANSMGFVGNSAMVDLRKALQDGSVSFDDLNKKFIELGTGTGVLAERAKINSEGIKNSLTNISNSFINGLAKVIEKANELSMLFTGSTIAQHIDSLKGTFSGAFDVIVQKITEAQPFIEDLKNRFNNMKESFAPMGDLISEVFGKMKTAIQENAPSITDVLDTVEEGFQWVIDNKELVIASIIGIGTAFATFAIISAVTSAIGALAGALTFLLSPIGLVVLAVGLLVAAGVALYLHWDELKAWAIEKWNGIKDAISTAIENAKNAVSNKVEEIKSKMSNVWESIKSKVTEVWNNIKTTISEAIDKAKTNVSNAIDKIKNFFTSIGDIDLFEVGKNVIQGLINGIGSMVNAVRDKISEVADGIKDKITGALGIHSPSRWMRDEVGKFIPQGIALGIEADSKTTMKAMSNMTTDLMSGITPELALGTSRIGMASTGSQIVNNTYNSSNSDLAGMVEAIANRPIVTTAVVDAKSFNKANAPYQSARSARRNQALERGLALDTKL